MRTMLQVLHIFCRLVFLALIIYGVVQLLQIGENFFLYFGKASFCFLLAYGCSKVLDVIQRKIDTIDVIKNPYALKSRLMDMASARLGDIHNVDEQTRYKMIEKELDWMEEQERDAKRRANLKDT